MHLPFLQTVLESFAVVPLVVGEVSAEQVAEVMERLWGGPETLMVISSDLSHFLDYDTARRVDAATCAAIEALDPGAIGYDQACGRVPVSGLLVLARRRGLAVTTLDVRNSSDTAGDRRRVVGYGSWMFVEPKRTAENESDWEGTTSSPVTDQTQALLETHGATLLHLAAASITHGLRCGRPIPVDIGQYPEPLRQPGAAFVTLKKGKDLRGCVGSPEAHRPLADDVADNAFAAAFRDGRFPKLAADEVGALSMSVSVLSPPEAMTIADEDDLLGRLRPSTDGLIIRQGPHRALFLPQVWDTLPKPQTFLAHLKVKAGLDARSRYPDMQAWRFTARSVYSHTLPDPAALWT